MPATPGDVDNFVRAESDGCSPHWRIVPVASIVGATGASPRRSINRT